MKKLVFALLVGISVSYSETQVIQVIGGTGVPAGEYPWNVQVTYGNNDENQCSGALITDQIVLTAGHCIESNSNKSNYKFRVGGVDKNSGFVTSGYSQFARMQPYNPGANGDVLSNDLAVILLNRKVDNAKPIKISSIPLPDHNRGKFVGWGPTSSGGAASSTLQQADMTKINIEVCKSQFPSNNNPYPTVQTFCAIGANSINQGPCFGDSGGPFVKFIDGEWILFGIEAGGIGYCIQSGEPNVLQATAYQDTQNWIRTATAAYGTPTFVQPVLFNQSIQFLLD